MPRVVVACLCLVLVAACSETTGSSGNVANQNFEASAPLNQDIDMTGRIRLRVQGINGNVEVTGVSGTETLQIRGERTVKSESVEDAEANLPNLQVELVTSSTEVVLRTVQPQNPQGRGYEVTYLLSVPERLATVSSTINGNVIVVDMQNVVNANTTNGNVDITDITGDVFGQVVNGNAIGRTAVAPSGTVLLEATNGNVTLDVPVTTSATAVLTVVNGSILVTGLTPTNVSSSPTSWSGTLGSGQGAIGLNTVNGNATLRGF